ncbi:MAG: hypothetical protein H0T62_04405 [Parachlamydiaceae bacterium]|nr:hypothetical protein [Parachlamydiaceae bacterium]
MFIQTAAIAFVIVLIAMALLGIGWLLTGKPRIQPGACGRAPTQKKTRTDECGQKASCQLCEHDKKKSPGHDE